MQVRVFAEILGILCDLHDQLAGRGNNQRAGFTGKTLIIDRVIQQFGNNSHQKSGCFTGTGLGFTHYIVGPEGKRQRAGLNR